VPSPQNREEVLLAAALGRPPAERTSFLEGACFGDPALRQRLDARLAAHDKPELSSPDSPAVVAATKLDLAHAELEVVGKTFGRYKVMEKLGEGGYGVVYVAEQTEPVRRRVALKVIKLGMDTKQVVARFEAERQALAMMDHANIAKVLDAGSTDNGRPYFVMELVPGIKITDFCDQDSLATKDRLDLFIKVCQAIQHAHQKGIIHRDIKPSNILVTLQDGVAVPKVIDFGIAKATEGRLTDATIYTQLHPYIGTPAYMSPEQVEMTGLDIDTRSDIYSMGVLLYELLVATTPFDAFLLTVSGLDTMRRTIREVEPVRPSIRFKTLKGGDLTTTAKRRSADPAKLLHQLKGDLDWIVMKCLEKDRVRRYDTANGLAMDLKRYLNNEPVLARPPSAAYRFQKLVRRNKLAFVASIAVAAALLLGFIVSTAQAIRATRAKLDAQAAQSVARAAEKEQSHLRVVAQEAQTAAEANAEKFKTTAVESRRGQYAADMFAASTEIERGDYVNARNFLREYLPREGSEELRGFEWRYWWQLSAGQQLRTFPVSGIIHDMCWSPDGRLIAEADSDGTVRLLHVDTGKVAAVFTNGSGREVSVAFSHDGNGLAAASSSGTVHFWDVRTGRLIFALTNYSVPTVACSPAGPLMAIGTGGDWWAEAGADVHLVDTKSGQELRVLPKAGDRAVFSPDGKRIASANWGGWDSGLQAVILWDVDSGQKLNVLEDMRQVLGMAFSRDGSLLAIGTRQGQVTLWNLHDFSHDTLRKRSGDIARSVALSADGRWLEVGMQTQDVEVWNVPERRQVESFRGHTAEITAVRYSPDGAKLASCAEDGTIRFWDPPPAAIQKLVPEVQLRAYSFWVGNPTFSPDSRWVAAGTTNGDVQIVDPTTPNWNTRMVLTNAGLPVAFSSDAATLLTVILDLKTLRRWNITSGALLSTTALNSPDSQWHLSAATLDGNRLALARGNVIEVYETGSGGRLAHFESPVGAASLEFSPDGHLLAIGGFNSGAICDLASGLAVRTFAGHKDQVVCVRFSPDQKMIATTSWDATVRLWEVATGKLLAVLTGHKAGVMNGIFSPDGRTLVTGSDDRTLRFWNVATRREVASIQLDSSPYCFAFSPDGQILMANAGDSAIRCWRAPSLAEIDAAEAR
jgi:WD40 repeat protein